MTNKNLKIYLTRHGQSQWQVDRNDDDSNWNSELSALGHGQAARLGDWLRDHQTFDMRSRVEIGAVRVSPMIRAQQTAVPICEALGLTAVTDKHLHEADFWISEHLPHGESPQQPAKPIPLSQQYTQFKTQANQALMNLVQMAETQSCPVLGVAHGALISTILREAVGSDTVSFWIYNTSLNLIEWKRGRWHLTHLNSCDHLPPEMRTF